MITGSASPVELELHAEPAPARRAPAGERGSVTVLVAGVLVLLSAVAVLVVRVGAASSDRARAQAAADAAALAGVVDGAAAASDYAARNGGSLVGWADAGDEVEVVVVVGEARAVARARRLDPLPPVLDTVPDTSPDAGPDLPPDTVAVGVVEPLPGPDDHPSGVLYALPASGL